MVELVRCMGLDEAIEEAARLCYRSIAKNEGPSIGLFNRLIESGHETPFEHCVFTFNVKVPLFVARQWMRHRIGSFNEVSLRYCDAEPTFFVPTEIIGTELEDEWISDSIDTFALYQKWQEKLTPKVGVKRARELARTFIIMGLYTEFIWTVNARSLMNFISLRYAPDAQPEIQREAQEILDLVKIESPVAFGLFEQIKLG